MASECRDHTGMNDTIAKLTNCLFPQIEHYEEGSLREKKVLKNRREQFDHFEGELKNINPNYSTISGLNETRLNLVLE